MEGRVERGEIEKFQRERDRNRVIYLDISKVIVLNSLFDDIRPNLLRENHLVVARRLSRF